MICKMLKMNNICQKSQITIQQKLNQFLLEKYLYKPFRDGETHCVILEMPSEEDQELNQQLTLHRHIVREIRHHRSENRLKQ